MIHNEVKCTESVSGVIEGVEHYIMSHLRVELTAAAAAGAPRYEKIPNNSSFGIIDIADSSTSDRIIVIVDTTCFIHDGAYR